MAFICPYSQIFLFLVLAASRFCFFITSFTSIFKFFWTTSVILTNNAKLYFYPDTCSLPAARKNTEL